MRDLFDRLRHLPPEQRALLERRLRGAKAAPQPVARISRLEIHPLMSFAQERLWFLEQLNPGSAFYNLPFAYRLRGRLDPTALETALCEVVRRHEALRTTFAAPDAQPIQVVSPSLHVSLPVVEIGQGSAQEREREALRLVTEQARKPFDLAAGPLLRALLVRLGETDHILALNMHHIVSDGWSLGVLNRELSALYGAFLRGEPSPLSELPLQYLDYSHWQRSWLQGGELEKELSYWKERLQGAPPVLELPSDRPRPAVKTYQGALYSFRLPGALVERLKELSRQEGATLVMTLLAAFNVLLYRYTGQEDILVGTAAANRRRPETEDLIGLLVNTLVLRTDLSGEPTFRELIRLVRESALAAYEHEDLPFEKLVEALQPERSLTHTPLFQVMFVSESATGAGLALPEVSSEPVLVDTGTAKFDLTLFINDGPDGASGVFEYSTDLYDAATIERMAGHLLTLLEGIVADPDRPIWALPILTESERHQLLVEWNATGRDYPRDKCVHQLFDEQAKRTPERVAVVFEEEQLTYAELNRRANRLAHCLQKLGVGPEVLVALCIERSLDMVVGLLGILKAGGAYVPLDPAYPSERLAFMLDDTRAPVLLTQESLLPSLPPYQGQVICLDRDWKSISTESPELPQSSVSAENLAYVIYTSGSTGKPKGVCMPHRALVNLLSWHSGDQRLSVPARTLQFAPLSFDVSFQECFTTLQAGGTLVLVSEPDRRNFQALNRLIGRKVIGRIFVPSVALQGIAQAASQESDCVSSLTDIITAGEQLQITTAVREMCSRLPNCRLYNHYGPSETHVVTTFRLPSAPESWPLLPPIGRPIGNTHVYILDSKLQPVPIGVIGEIWLGGDCVARGYLSRPALTSERFTESAIAEANAELVYRTGDLARYRETGDIEFLGRSDGQVKIRGHRVELGEIEATLLRHPAVVEAIAVLGTLSAGAKAVFAYVVPGPRMAAPEPEELKGFLRRTLPDYMIPASIECVRELPQTPSGKLHRGILPPPMIEKGAATSIDPKPQDATEAVLAQIWAEVLGLDHVALDQSFFSLGGHSLLVGQVISLVRRRLGVEAPFHIVFEQPTVTGFAREARSLMESQSDIRNDAIRPIPRESRRKSLASIYAPSGAPPVDRDSNDNQRSEL